MALVLDEALTRTQAGHQALWTQLRRSEMVVLRERRGVRIVDPLLAEWLRRRYQAVKSRQREGMSHRDLLRLAHPGAAVTAGNPRLAVSDEQARLFEWIVRGGDTDGLPAIVEGFVRAQAAATATEGTRAT